MREPIDVDHIPEDVMRLAVGAVLAAIKGDHLTVDLLMVQAVHAYPGAGLPLVGLVWCDLYLQWAAGGPAQAIRLGAPERSTFFDQQGRTVTYEQAPETAQWAARMLRTRGNLDRDGNLTVQNELQGKTFDQQAAYYRALLTTVAKAVSNLPLGWGARQLQSRSN